MINITKKLEYAQMMYIANILDRQIAATGLPFFKRMLNRLIILCYAIAHDMIVLILRTTK